MMTLHRFTDSLIEKRKLFTRWPITETITTLQWKTLINIVGKSIFIFWIPAHTVTFSLPSEYRVLSAALLAIALGAILGVSKKREGKQTT